MSKIKGQTKTVLGILLTIIIIAAAVSIYLFAIPKEGEDVEEWKKSFFLASKALTSPVDVAQGRYVDAYTITRQVYEGLVKYEGSEIKPCLAEDYVVSPDGLNYTFKLRKGVKFQDGTPCNASAVKFGYDRYLAIGLGYARELGSEVLERIEVLDDYTISFILEEPFSPLLYHLGMMGSTFVISPTAVKEHEVNGDWGADWARENAVGTGPYLLKEYKMGEYCILEKFDEYWGGWEGSHVESIVLKFVSEPSTQRLMLETGEVDAAEQVLYEDYRTLKEAETYNVIGPENYHVISALGISAYREPLNDIRVREAIRYCIDYDDIIDTAYLGFASPMTTPLPEGFPGYDSALDGYREWGKQNVTKARILMKDAGYSGESGANDFTLRIGYIAPFEGYVRAAEIILRDLREIGIAATIQGVSGSTWKIMKADPETFFDLAVHHSTPYSLDPDIQFAKNYLPAGFLPAGLNYAYFNDSRVNELCENATRIVDISERTKLYSAAQKIIMDYTPKISLCAMGELFVCRDWVKGVENIPCYSRTHYFYNVWKDVTPAAEKGPLAGNIYTLSNKLTNKLHDDTTMIVDVDEDFPECFQ